MFCHRAGAALTRVNFNRTLSPTLTLPQQPQQPPSRTFDQHVLTDGKDEEHLSRGVYDTYTNTSLR